MNEQFVMTHSHYRRYTLWLEVLLGGFTRLPGCLISHEILKPFHTKDTRQLIGHSL